MEGVTVRHHFVFPEDAAALVLDRLLACRGERRATSGGGVGGAGPSSRCVGLSDVAWEPTDACPEGLDE